MKTSNKKTNKKTMAFLVAMVFLPLYVSADEQSAEAPQEKVSLDTNGPRDAIKVPSPNRPS